MGLLRRCPTCHTPVSEANLGLRDFAWVNEVLPGKLGLMDIDGALTQDATGRGLFFELKPRGETVSTGARLTFKALRRAGFDVWVIWDEGDGRHVVRGVCDRNGRVRNKVRMTRQRAAALVARWWQEGLQLGR